MQNKYTQKPDYSRGMARYKSLRHTPAVSQVNAAVSITVSISRILTGLFLYSRIFSIM
jgi:hypothetical protein